MHSDCDQVSGSIFSHVAEDALLLSEFTHRTANEIAAAAAALHLAKRDASVGGRRMLGAAAERLEAFGELHRVLARPVRRRVDASQDLTAVCRAITAGASRAERSVVVLEVPETWTDGRTARRVVLVAAELVANAVRHALQGRAGRLEVSLAVVGDEVVLRVGDDGRGMRPGTATSGTGLGGGIVAELVGRSGGSMTIETGGRGTTVLVTFPLSCAEDGDDVAF